MLSRVSQLIAISLLCLVGCSGRASNNNEPAFPKKTSVTESELSGCWSQSLGVGGTLWFFGLSYAMDWGYKGWIFVNCF